uniref:isopentenyl-diphosphate Delta-isomerase n=1 Tax=Clastoptera arizonana TaxID=38151 RepID=A0A1B6C3P3_9HEMI
MLKSLQNLTRRNMYNEIKFRIHSKAKINPTQESALQENCILVDENDRNIGAASKYKCHRLTKDGKLPLHRAFSVFIFNNKNEMLLQKRSQTKVTFPNYYTNACCSHPLSDIEEEMNETNAIGVKLAARRRLEFELGIPQNEIDINKLMYLTRIHYFSKGDGVWGEHEIDYILLMKQDLILKPNPDEVGEVCYVGRNDFSNFLKTLSDPVTPWFKLIVHNTLLPWWDNLHQLDKFKNVNSIQKF